MKIQSVKELENIKKDFGELKKKFKYTAHICFGAGCVSSECKDMKDAFVRALEEEQLQSEIKVNLTGCMGACTLGPTIIINPGGVLYCNLTPENVNIIVKDHLKNGKIVESLCYKDKNTGKAIPYLKEIDFFKRQQKIVLQKCGVIDYGSLDEYISLNGYFALAKVLKEMSPEALINEIKKSGLRGRGGEVSRQVSNGKLQRKR